MKINLERLRDHGFHVELNRDKTELTINPDNYSPLETAGILESLVERGMTLAIAHALVEDLCIQAQDQIVLSAMKRSEPINNH